MGSLFISSAMIGFIYFTFFAVTMLKVQNLKMQLIFIQALSFRFGRVYQFVRKLLLYNFVLRFFFETYIEFVIDIFINLKIGKKQNRSQIFSYILSWVAMGISLLFPIFMVIKLLRNKDKIGKQEFDNKFNSMYESLNLYKFDNVMYNVIFLMRRLIFALAAVYLQEHPVFQIQLQVFFSFFIFIFVFSKNPFKEKGVYVVEVLNEFCILAISYSLFAFYFQWQIIYLLRVQMAIQNSSKPINLTYLSLTFYLLVYSIGWYPIFIVIMNILSNTLYMNYQTIRALIAFIRKLKINAQLIARVKQVIGFRIKKDTMNPQPSLFANFKDLQQIKDQNQLSETKVVIKKGSFQGFVSPHKLFENQFLDRSNEDQSFEEMIQFKLTNQQRKETHNSIMAPQSQREDKNEKNNFFSHKIKNSEGTTYDGQNQNKLDRTITSLLGPNNETIEFGIENVDNQEVIYKTLLHNYFHYKVDLRNQQSTKELSYHRRKTLQLLRDFKIQDKNEKEEDVNSSQNSIQQKIQQIQQRQRAQSFLEATNKKMKENLFENDQNRLFKETLDEIESPIKESTNQFQDSINLSTSDLITFDNHQSEETWISNTGFIQAKIKQTRKLSEIQNEWLAQEKFIEEIKKKGFKMRKNKKNNQLLEKLKSRSYFFIQIYD